MKYTQKNTQEISFPLGGIGSGCIGLAGNGRLIDWEIFNRPNKGAYNGFSHFAVRALDGDTVVDARVLNGDLIGPVPGDYGYEQKSMAGFPHFADCVFDGRFPLARLDFADPHFPGAVTLTAFNPFVPNDADDSSLPAAFFEITLENTADRPLTYGAALSVCNPFKTQSRNAAVSQPGMTLVRLGSDAFAPDSLEYGELCFGTDCPDADTQTYWYRGSWNDRLETYWRNLTEKPRMPARDYPACGTGDDTALIEARVTLRPGERRSVRFVLGWYYPNTYHYWDLLRMADWNVDPRTPWKNYYAVLFDGAADVARTALKNWDALYGATQRFTQFLYDSTLPAEILEAVSATLSVLKSPTVLRLQDGLLYGWEGVHKNSGSCEGSCSHVWNYACALPFLFPALARSMRDLDYRYNLDETGRLRFRLMLPLGVKWNHRACVDGQMGSIFQVYREWKLCGDGEWLKKLWPSVKKAMEYAWSPENPDRWDPDRDGVLEGRQHHTLDMELFGPSGWLQGFYLTALAAAAEMADFIGDSGAANEYRRIFDSGRKKTDELFNGSYYAQKIDLSDREMLTRYGDAPEVYWNDEAAQIKYQIGDGCEIDQLLGQWHADLCGLGLLFDPDHLQTAMHSLYRNNFKACLREFYNPFRLFSINDEAGTVICSYPEGAVKPAIPIPYCQETMHGFEYAAAALLYERGLREEGLAMVRAVRDKYDGVTRNPYNEMECGNNYARSMAVYSFLPLLSGFSYDLGRGKIGFAPVDTGARFTCLWSVGGGWGSIEITPDGAALTVAGCDATFALREIGLPFDCELSAQLDGRPLTALSGEKGIVFADPLPLRPDPKAEKPVQTLLLRRKKS